MKRLLLTRFLLLCLLAPLLPSPLAAQERDGDAGEGAIFLLLPLGAKAVALGRTVTPLPGPESVFWNPAGLAELDDSQLVLYRGDYLAGVGTGISGIFSRAGLGAVGVSYLLLDVGEQDFRDEQGNVLGTITIRNHLGVVSVATRIRNRLNAGFNFKVVQFRLSCRGQCIDAGVAATTYALDAGLQVTDVGGLPLRLGAMIAHAGPRFQVRNEAQADPLPTRVRVAAAYEVLGHLVPEQPLQLLVAVELENRWRELDDPDPALYLGSEFSAGLDQGAQLLVRAGYVKGNGEQVDGAAVGVGIRYDRFDLAIAKSLATTISGETEPVHVTFGLVF